MTSSPLDDLFGRDNLIETDRGNLCCFVTGELSVSRDLDHFALHDSLLFYYEFTSNMMHPPSISLYGLFPCFSSVFKVDFKGVSNFSSSSFNPLECFSVRELSLLHEGKIYAQFDGDFEGQFFNFSFTDAKYEKYTLRSPVLRRDLGL